jgi:hypothetical protein
MCCDEVIQKHACVVGWYEFQIGKNRAVTFRQQGTCAPDTAFPGCPGPAIDRLGNIGIGYSFGSATTSPASASRDDSRTTRSAR